MVFVCGTSEASCMYVPFVLYSRRLHVHMYCTTVQHKKLQKLSMHYNYYNKIRMYYYHMVGCIIIEYDPYAITRYIMYHRYLSYTSHKVIF